ncbi:hypothetical protein LQZ18_15605 [Lachnospiraceae bacterium ZAX-1]
MTGQNNTGQTFELSFKRLNMKRVLAILMTVCLTLSLVPFDANVAKAGFESTGGISISPTEVSIVAGSSAPITINLTLGTVTPGDVTPGDVTPGDVTPGERM